MKKFYRTRILYLFFLPFILAGVVNAQTTLIAYGSNWKYLDNNTRPANWETSAFDDAAWTTDYAQFGYGDGDENTIVNYGGCTPIASCGPKYITTYFRKTITITDPSVYSGITMNIKRDDGVVVYINGTERYSNNMPAGRLHSTLASAAASDDGNTVQTTTLLTSYFSAGTNVIAVEIHQNIATSGDMSFDMELVGNDAFSGTLLRGPYLQVGGQTAITIRWRTSTSQNSKVEMGTVLGSYPIVVTDPTSTTEHIVRVTGLSPDTKYYYIIGNSSIKCPPDPDKFFTTAPPASTTRVIRVAAFGDCGRGNIAYQDQNLANYRNYLATNSIDAADAWILLGDNAYNSGTDAEFTSNFFGIYGSSLLKNHKLYPAPGNHDYGNAAGNKTSRMMPYYNSFSVPQLGECGGVASNRPNYYSFDIGNIHFLSLDSWGIETDDSNKDMGSAGNSILKTWIDNDLAANTGKWIIAYWHHPPYTKGSHDSDNGGGADPELPLIRTNFIPYLEARGVDMIVCGHSHCYERSYLIHNYTGNWASFNPATHAVSSSTATYTSNTTCPYVYNAGPTSHGTVYVVSGTAGASGGTQAGFGTKAMPWALSDAGIFYFEVQGNRLDAKMLRGNGTIFDRFTIMRDVNKTSNITIHNGDTRQLTASWPGTYTWSTLETTASINVTPPSNATTVYTVTDALGCVADQFSITTSIFLPVQLVEYSASLVRHTVALKWTVGAETDAQYFRVERSVNGRDYTGIGTVDGTGNHQQPQVYAFTDATPPAGSVYYRLVMADRDGHTSYLGIKKIENNYPFAEVKSLSGFSGRLVLDIKTSFPGQYRLRVYDVAGRLFKDDQFALTGSVQLSWKLPPGFYVWELKDSKGEVLTQKSYVQ
ncbi:MAG: metallophosphoesterase family protein [Chitinophagaceae bacterium]|nr:metallophosphoesterase family protein [Chitinophagaceae bacterium]